nr:hypothetical protein [Roseovarius sp. BRH_c41]
MRGSVPSPRLSDCFDAVHGNVVEQMRVELGQVGALALPVEPEGESRWSG